MSGGLAMMPWYPGDFLRSTRGWSVTEKGVYRELLDAQWDMGILPADPARLCEMIGATQKEWSSGWARCESKFPLENESARRNPTLERHRAKSIEITAKRALGAQKTNAQRYGERSLSDTQSDPISDSLSARIQSTPIHIHSNPDQTIAKIPEKNKIARAGQNGHATRLPADWRPNESQLAYAAEWKLDPARTALEFTEYWWARPGKEATKLDWNLTWRRWCRSNHDRMTGADKPVRKTRFEEAMDKLNVETDE